MILVELQKAFDTINHKILLKKPEAKASSDQFIWWFWSYLYEQMFFIEIGNQLSSYRKILCGVPQGSSLGPFMFLIYFNDVLQAVKSNDRK